MLLVPQPVWIEAPVFPVPESVTSSAPTPSGPRIVSSPYYRVERGGSEWRDPLLGIQAEEVDEQLAAHLGARGGRGVVIRQVAPNTPAEKAGLQPGDIVVSVDGKPVRSVYELQSSLQGSLDPENVPVSLLRGGVQMSVILQAE